MRERSRTMYAPHTPAPPADAPVGTRTGNATTIAVYRPNRFKLAVTIDSIEKATAGSCGRNIAYHDRTDAIGCTRE